MRHGLPHLVGIPRSGLHPDFCGLKRGEEAVGDGFCGSGGGKVKVSAVVVSGVRVAHLGELVLEVFVACELGRALAGVADERGRPAAGQVAETALLE